MTYDEFKSKQIELMAKMDSCVKSNDVIGLVHYTDLLDELVTDYIAFRKVKKNGVSV